MDEDLTGAVILEPRNIFDSAIVGKMDSEEGSVLVYSYEKIVENTATKMFDGPEPDYEGAIEWVDYNTIRGIAYMGDRRPMVVYDVTDLDI